MDSTSAREYLVIFACILIGWWIVGSTFQHLRRSRRFPPSSSPLHPIEMLARLLLGAGLVLLALFLLAGRTLWAGAAASAAPAWAAPVGLVILAGVLLAGLVVAACAVARRLRAQLAKPR